MKQADTARMRAILRQFAIHRWLPAMSRARPMIAIREGLLWTLPILLLSSLLMFLAVFGELAGIPPAWRQMLLSVNMAVTASLPWLIAGSIGYILAVLHRLPQLPVASFCMVQIPIFQQIFSDSPQVATTLAFLVAMVLPLVSVPLIAWLRRWRWLRMAPSSITSGTLRDTLNLVLPCCLTGSALMIVLYAMLYPMLDLQHDLGPVLVWLDARSPYLVGPVLAAINSVSWFFGVHGSYLQQPLLDMLDTLARAQADGTTVFLSRNLFSVFAYIGGSGATLSLIIAILLFAPQKALRTVALLSLPTALINVNEILLFGIPIILNPRLLLPFVAIPVINIVLTLLAMQIGWLSVDVMQLPFSTPVLLNAYTLGAESSAAVLWQIALIALGTACYAPFVRMHERKQGSTNTVHLQSLDITFSRLQEESQLLVREPIKQSVAQASRSEADLDRMREISHCHFHLNYQPQVSLHSGLCSGCEALLRVQTPDGQTHSSGQFLQWLNQANLMPEVDLWVAHQAVSQHLAWKAEGFSLPMTINACSETLSHPATLDKLVHILAKADGMISVELTEESLVGDPEAIQHTIARLHGIGSRIYIDDFGTGYAALSHLARYDIDAVKLDRSFMLHCDTQKGMRVLSGVLRLCHGLGLRIVVEGVETDAQMHALRMASPTDVQIQGWFFSKSLDSEQLREFARQRAQRLPAER